MLCEYVSLRGDLYLKKSAVPSQSLEYILIQTF
jgi:hypothetical protein